MLGPKIWAFACVILKSSMGKGRSKVYTIPVSSDHFKAVNANLMLFQVCQDNKIVDVGDRLVLVETDGNNAPSGAVIACVVTYKQPGGALGIESGHCVLGLYKKGLNPPF